MSSILLLVLNRNMEKNIKRKVLLVCTQSVIKKNKRVEHMAHFEL